MTGPVQAAQEVEHYNETLDRLTRALFYRDFDIDEEVDISNSKLKRSAWINSIIANSENDEDKEKALAFAVLAYIYKKGSEQQVLYERYLYFQLSRLGSLPTAITFFSENETDFESWDEQGTSSILVDELDHTERLYSINEETVLSDFQLDIWHDLDDQYTVISGPTSSGKSFVIQEYLKQSSDSKLQCVYIVPTRALISEVSGDLREELPDVDILTGAHLDTIEKDNFVLVLTPERCLSLMDHYDDEDIDIGLIFIDEIQKLQDDSRGPLYENILESLQQNWPNAKIVGAGPYISNPEEIFSDLFGIEAGEVKSEFTPAFHLTQSFIIQKGQQDISVVISSPSGNELHEKIAKPAGLTHSGLSGRSSRDVAKLVTEFGGDSQNLVYANTKLRAENWANEIKNQTGDFEDNEDVQALAEFLSNSVHRKYTLVQCLKKGVAYHHAGVPKVAREEIERLYEEEILGTITCTPTLLEGVNLPAEKLFIVDPIRGKDTPLPEFDYNNLIGRVGRVGSKMYGSIILAAPVEDDWTEGRRESGAEEDVTPTTNRVIQNMRPELLDHIDDENIQNMPKRSLQYTISIIRNKYRKDSQEMESYLQRKGLGSPEIGEIRNKLGPLMDDMEIPNSILKKNPTVDPVLQDKLYRKVKRNIGDWEISPTSLKSDFFSVTQELNRLFVFVDDSYNGVELEEGMKSETKEDTLIRILYPGYLWLSGESYNKIIKSRMKEVGRESSVDSAIKMVLAIIRKDVRFVLVKYYKILCDILKSFEGYDNQFKMNFDKRLERGSYQSQKLELMDLGIDRSLAIQLDPPNEGDLESYLQKVAEDKSSLFKRHLQSQGLVDVEN